MFCIISKTKKEENDLLIRSLKNENEMERLRSSQLDMKISNLRNEIRLLKKKNKTILKEKRFEKQLRVNYSRLLNKYKNMYEKQYTELMEKYKAVKSDLEKCPRKLTEINVDLLCDQMADNAWNNRKNKLIIYSLNNMPILKLYGHTYEPGYEDFSATCAVYGYDDNGKEFVLFDKNDYSAGAYHHEVEITGSKKDIEDYIKEHDQYVIVN